MALRITDRKPAIDDIIRELASMMARALGISEYEARRTLMNVLSEASKGILITEKFRGSIISGLSYEELEKAYYEMKG